MAKSLYTVEYERALKQFLLARNPDIEISFERQLPTGGRVDCITFEECEHTNRPIATNYEIKISRADLNSGYGLNFNGDYNYLCVTPNIFHAAKEKLGKINRFDVGLILYCDGIVLQVRDSKNLWFARPWDRHAEKPIQWEWGS